MYCLRLINPIPHGRSAVMRADLIHAENGDWSRSCFLHWRPTFLRRWLRNKINRNLNEDSLPLTCYHRVDGKSYWISICTGAGQCISSHLCCNVSITWGNLVCVHVCVLVSWTGGLEGKEVGLRLKHSMGAPGSNLKAGTSDAVCIYDDGGIRLPQDAHIHIHTHTRALDQSYFCFAAQKSFVYC